MGIDSTISEQFTPDRMRRRQVLQCSVSAGGDIITPIFTGFRDHCAGITIKNTGANALVSLEVLVDVAPEMSDAVSVAADEGLWRATTGLATLPAGDVGVLWIERPLGAYFAVKAVGNGTLGVVLDMGMFYAQPAS